MKTKALCVWLIWGLFGCEPAPPQQASSPVVQPPLSDTLKQPLDHARDTEKQIFESADQQKQQAEQI